MNIWYIQESQKKIINFFHVIEIENIDSRVLINVPMNEKTNNHRVVKLAKKTISLLQEKHIKNVAISQNLSVNQLFKDILNSEHINVLDGRRLFFLLSKEIIKEICKVSKTNIENIEISILVNEFKEENLLNIIDIAKDVRRLNIITSDIKKFEKLQEYLYNNFGIMTKLSNNKQKSLTNSNIILNIDFTNIMLNEYRLPYKAVILNIYNKIDIKAKYFNGININDYNIITKEEFKINQFSNKIVYESIIYGYSFNEAKEKFIKDNIEVTEFIGNNGKIKDEELQQIFL